MRQVMQRPVIEVHHKKEDSGCGCFGCMTIIVFVIFVWMLVFGVTVNGVHHEMSCNLTDGVRFDSGNNPQPSEK